MKAPEEILKEAIGEARFKLEGSIMKSQIMWAMKEYAAETLREASDYCVCITDRHLLLERIPKLK